jgi:hypothetical protein
MYKINNHHDFKFRITANVERAVLILDKSEMSFNFDEGYLDETLRKAIKIENRSNSKITYAWRCGDKGFSVEPMTGEVEANSIVKS